MNDHPITPTPDPEQQELPVVEAEIIDYYNALAAQHPGQCVFHAPTSQEHYEVTQ